MLNRDGLLPHYLARSRDYHMADLAGADRLITDGVLLAGQRITMRGCAVKEPASVPSNGL
jgi:hypothetical protein